jgi:hypothetical protein
VSSFGLGTGILPRCSLSKDTLVGVCSHYFREHIFSGHLGE